jgi:NADPH-dependent glutamate synthase beta subunit-like oxidoreductase
MREMGILFRPNFSLGGSTSIQDLLDDGYRSVFVGTGAWKPRKLGVPGETFGHVFYAINYLNKAIYNRFKDLNIEIAYNQIDMYIKNVKTEQEIKIDATPREEKK